MGRAGGTAADRAGVHDAAARQQCKVVVRRHQSKNSGIPQVLAGGCAALQGIFHRRPRGRELPQARRGDHRDGAAGAAVRGQLLQERRTGVGRSRDRDRPFEQNALRRERQRYRPEKPHPRELGEHPQRRGQRLPHRGAGQRAEIHAADGDEPRRAVHRDQGGERRGHRAAVQHSVLQARRGQGKLCGEHTGRHRVHAANAQPHRFRARAGGHVQAAARERERTRLTAAAQHDGRAEGRLERPRRVVSDYAPKRRLLRQRHLRARGPAGRARRRRQTGRLNYVPLEDFKKLSRSRNGGGNGREGGE